MWPELESNQRHKDFQSSALPTELSGHQEVSSLGGHCMKKDERDDNDPFHSRTIESAYRLMVRFPCFLLEDDHIFHNIDSFIQLNIARKV